MLHHTIDGFPTFVSIWPKKPQASAKSFPQRSTKMNASLICATIIAARFLAAETTNHSWLHPAAASRTVRAAGRQSCDLHRQIVFQPFVHLLSPTKGSSYERRRRPQ